MCRWRRAGIKPMNTNTRIKSVDQYQELLKEFRIVQLERIKKLTVFLWQTVDTIGIRKNIVTIDEVMIRHLGLTIGDAKDFYTRFGGRMFEVFDEYKTESVRSEVRYLDSIPEDGKLARVIDFRFFPEGDPRSDNFRNFMTALDHQDAKAAETADIVTGDGTFSVLATAAFCRRGNWWGFAERAWPSTACITSTAPSIRSSRANTNRVSH